MVNLIQPTSSGSGLGDAIAKIGAGAFGNQAAIALRNAQLQALQRKNFGTEALAKQFADSPDGSLDTGMAAANGIAGGVTPATLAGMNLFVNAMKNGARAKQTTDAAAADGKYAGSAENLDLNRANVSDMNAARIASTDANSAASRANQKDIAGGHDQTSIYNSTYRTDSSSADSRYRTDASSKDAQGRTWADLYKFRNKPLPANINGVPGFVRAGDPDLAPAIESPDTNPYSAKIASLESGGDPNAKNPNSSATGDGQFTDATWMDTVSKHAPELLKGRTREQVLALRSDPELSGIMIDKLGEDNGAVLQSQGLPVTDGTKHLAHVFGAGVAVKIMKADPNAPIESIMPPEALAANPNFAGKTAGQVTAWANKGMGTDSAPTGDVPVDPTVANDVPVAPAAPHRTIVPIAKNGKQGQVTEDQAAGMTLLESVQPQIDMLTQGATADDPLPGFNAMGSLHNTAANALSDIPSFGLTTAAARGLSNTQGVLGRDALKAIAQAYLYAESGKSAPAEEVEKNAAMVTPSLMDNQAILDQKKKQLLGFINAIRAKAAHAQIAADKPIPEGAPAAAPAATSTGVPWKRL